jgi:hypothetical protein
MGKKRNTAKTGDKGLYKSREKLQKKDNNNKIDSDDDPMYNEIDRFHNKREEDYLKLDDDGQNDSDDEDAKAFGANKESVLDLGAGASSSEEDGDDSSSDDDDGRQKHGKNGSDDDDDDSSSPDSSDSDDDIENIKEMMEADDPRNWGKKKSLYYHGDTADLEIGQEEEDAFLEEEAAKEIQKSRFEEMEEEDFVLSEDDEGGVNQQKSSEKEKSSKEHDGTLEKLRTSRDASKLSKKEARELIQKQHPGKNIIDGFFGDYWNHENIFILNFILFFWNVELLPMVSYFYDIVKDQKERTDVARKALFQGGETAEVSSFFFAVLCFYVAFMIG